MLHTLYHREYSHIYILYIRVSVSRGLAALHCKEMDSVHFCAHPSARSALLVVVHIVHLSSPMPFPCERNIESHTDRRS